MLEKDVKKRRDKNTKEVSLQDWYSLNSVPFSEYCWWVDLFSKKSPTGPTERTPRPEYLIALATYLGVRW